MISADVHVVEPLICAAPFRLGAASITALLDTKQQAEQLPSQSNLSAASARMSQCQLCSSGMLLQQCSRFRVCGTRMTGTGLREGPFAHDGCKFHVISRSGTCGNGADGLARSTVVRAQNLGSTEMLVGDVVLLIAFCLYKQIMAIVMAPSFPGWLAPLHFDPVRFEELVGFIVTVAGTWVACSSLLGDYRNSSPSVFIVFCCDRDCDVQHASLFEDFMVQACRYAASPHPSMQNLAREYAYNCRTACSCNCS